MCVDLINKKLRISISKTSYQATIRNKKCLLYSKHLKSMNNILLPSNPSLAEVEAAEVEAADFHILE